MLPNCEWNQKQKHKKQPWNKVECFAFGGATVCFASLETSFHAAKHTIPPPPSYEGYPLCPKDKNRSPFHGEKPLIIKWFLGKKPHQISQTILHGRDAILCVRDKLLIFKMILQLWANVKYHVPTGFGFRQKAVLLFPQTLMYLFRTSRTNYRWGGIKKDSTLVVESLGLWALTDSNRRPSACKADALNQLS